MYWRHCVLDTYKKNRNVENEYKFILVICKFSVDSFLVLRYYLLY